MTDLTPNHPAVKAMIATRMDVGCASDKAAARLNAALPHLTADDLRDTDVAEEIRTEGWMQGWAAGRDLDGDEDATQYLRNTPAGRALMAEGWEEGVQQFAQHGDVDHNPYLEGDA